MIDKILTTNHIGLLPRYFMINKRTFDGDDVDVVVVVDGVNGVWSGLEVDEFIARK